MSVKWLNWAFTLPPEVKGSPRMVLLALADDSDDDGQSWRPIEPSEDGKRKGIMCKTALGKSAVQKALRSACATGYVTRTINGKYSYVKDGQEVRYDPDKRPTLYQLHETPVPEGERSTFTSGREDRGGREATPLDDGVDEKLPRGVDESTPRKPGQVDDGPPRGVDDELPRGVDESTPNPSFPPVIENQEREGEPEIQDDPAPEGSLSIESDPVVAIADAFASSVAAASMAFNGREIVVEVERSWGPTLAKLVEIEGQDYVEDLAVWLGHPQTRGPWWVAESGAMVTSPGRLAGQLRNKKSELRNQFEADRAMLGGTADVLQFPGAAGPAAAHVPACNAIESGTVPNLPDAVDPAVEYAQRLAAEAEETGVEPEPFDDRGGLAQARQALKGATS